MATVRFGLGAYDSNRYQIPPIVLENWYAEEAPEDESEGARLIPTPGLESFATGFTGAASGVFQADRVVGSNIIVCTDSNVYKVNTGGTVTQIDTVQSGGLAAQFAVSQTPELIMNKGGNVYKIGSTTVVDFTSSLPAGLTSDVIGVAEIAQRHLYAEENSGRVWYSDTADATTVQANSFFTAEQDADEMVAIHVSGDKIWLFGTKTTELWYFTGNSDAPFAYRGTTINKGLLGARAVTESDSATHFVGFDRMVYRMNGGTAERISTHPIDDVLEGETDLDGLELTSHTDKGHTFLKVHIPSYGDLFFDAATRLWHRRRRLRTTKSNFGYPVRAFNRLLFLGDAGGTTKLYEAKSSVFTDDGENVRRVATALAPIKDGRARVNRLTLDMHAGIGLTGSGQGSDPQIMMRVAKDGRTFGAEMKRSAGLIGQYGYRPTFGPLGVMSGPAVVVEVAISDPVGMSLNAAHVNLERP